MNSISRAGSNSELAPRSNLSPLEEAVLKTVAYVDIFDYPLTLPEIHRYLVGFPASSADVERVTGNGRLADEHLERQDMFFALPGRGAIIETRRKRARVAGQLWPIALRHGRLIAALPFVRMVAVTGSLAVDNAEANADIDYLVVTEIGRLWLSRAMVILVVRHAARRGVKLCPNYFVTERALLFSEHNLYTAWEVAQMVPIFGLETYERMRKLNSWVYDYLPNANGIPRRVEIPQNSVSNIMRRARDLTESTLRLQPGGWLEQWEMRRKVRRFSDRSGGAESSFSSDWCKGHFDSHGQQTMETFSSHWHDIEHDARIS